jgi:hypothetical protein
MALIEFFFNRGLLVVVIQLAQHMCCERFWRLVPNGAFFDVKFAFSKLTMVTAVLAINSDFLQVRAVK